MTRRGQAVGTILVALVVMMGALPRLAFAGKTSPEDAKVDPDRLTGAAHDRPVAPPKTAAAARKLAQEQINDDDYVAAFATLAAAVKRFPRDMDLVQMYAVSQVSLANPQGALDAITPFLKSHPNDGDLLSIAAGANIIMGNDAAAVPILKRAIALAPDDDDLKARLERSETRLKMRTGVRLSAPGQPGSAKAAVEAFADDVPGGNFGDAIEKAATPTLKAELLSARGDGTQTANTYWKSQLLDVDDVKNSQAVRFEAVSETDGDSPGTATVKAELILDIPNNPAIALLRGQDAIDVLSTTQGKIYDNLPADGQQRLMTSYAKLDQSSRLTVYFNMHKLGDSWRIDDISANDRSLRKILNDAPSVSANGLGDLHVPAYSYGGGSSSSGPSTRTIVFIVLAVISIVIRLARMAAK